MSEVPLYSVGSHTVSPDMVNSPGLSHTGLCPQRQRLSKGNLGSDRLQGDVGNGGHAVAWVLRRGQRPARFGLGFRVEG